MGSAIKRKEIIVPNIILRVPTVDPKDGAKGETQYRLKGILSHIGGHATEGHYIYFEYHSSNDGFWIHDDDQVTYHPRVGPLNALLPNPYFDPLFRGSYLLFYEKVDL
jgi:hypothetical protein